MKCACGAAFLADDLFCGECGAPRPRPRAWSGWLIALGLGLGAWSVWGLTRGGPVRSTPTPTETTLAVIALETHAPPEAGALYSLRGDVNGDGLAEQLAIVRDEKGTYLRILTHDGFPRFTSAPFAREFEPQFDHLASDPLDRAGLHLLPGVIKIVFSADPGRAGSVTFYRYDAESETFRSTSL